MLSEERRRQIADFLKSRRMRRQPEELGLPRGHRRRTPGLRREEVAAAADVSAEWYTWLEQAREVRPSAEVLSRIGAALRLEPHETRHLLTLGGYAIPVSGPDLPQSVSVSLRLQRLIDQMEFGPAWVLGERWDILAWNRAASVIHDPAALQGIERNALYQIFLNPRVRAMLMDWEVHAPQCVAQLRATYASRVDDPWFNELVSLIRTRSVDFERWWNQNDIQAVQEGVKHLEHPEGGRLVFDYTVLEVQDERMSSLRLVAYVPAPGTGTREKMEKLLEARQPLLIG
jgi:transcriptional regulator with XRE-family HTH domain